MKNPRITPVKSDGNNDNEKIDDSTKVKKGRTRIFAARTKRSTLLKFKSTTRFDASLYKEAEVINTGTPASRAFHESANVIKSRKVLLLCTILILAHLGIGVLIGMKMESWNFVDSLYFSVITLTTVGYGDVKPQTGAAKIAIAFYIILGLVLITSALAVVGEYVMDKLDGDESETEEDSKLKNRWLTAPQQKLLFSALSILLVSTVGVMFFMFIEDYTFTDSFYLVVATLSTVGYGDHSPTGTKARIFTTVWVAVGNLVVARGIGAFLDHYLEKKQNKLRKKILQKKMDMTELFAADSDNSGTITEAEFIIFKIEQMGLLAKNQLTEISNQFHRLDVDKSGYLTKEEALGIV